METTERVPRDQLNHLVALSKPSDGMRALPPIVASSIEEAVHRVAVRRHDSVVAAILPPIPAPKPKRMRAPTLVGTAPVVAAMVAKPIVVVEVPRLEPTPSVAIAPAVVAASVRPHRFAIAALLYALVLFALLAAF